MKFDFGEVKKIRATKDDLIILSLSNKVTGKEFDMLHKWLEVFIKETGSHVVVFESGRLKEAFGINLKEIGRENVNSGKLLC